jgi:diguanylate cyclase (GGDEF)-like protein/PAS domain S-box-containing protein
MDIARSFSLFQTLSAIVLIIASIFLALRMRKEIPGSIRNELNRTTSLIFLIFSGYTFFVFIMVGNVHYPIQPVTASMLLGSACFVYADIMLIKSLIQTINQKDKEINQYIADLERENFERKKAEGALLLLDKAAKTTRTGITIRDGKGRILYINPAEAEMHGYSAEDLLGEDISVFVTPDMRKPLALEELRDAKTWMRETVNYRRDGSVFPVKLVSDIVRDEAGEPVAIVTTCEDISERKEQEEELKRHQNHLEELVKERTRKLTEVVAKLENEIKVRKRTEEQIKFLAYYDSLTNLPNRMLFMDRFEQALEHAKRHDGLLGILFLDLDNFKHINDTFGHNVGDLLLKEVAEKVAASLRKSDSVIYLGTEGMAAYLSRLGGDEFVILLSRINNADDAALVARRIIEALSQPVLVNGNEISITASIGITLFPFNGENAEVLLKNADAAMYQAKDLGRNNYQFFSQSRIDGTF